MIWGVRLVSLFRPLFVLQSLELEIIHFKKLHLDMIYIFICFKVYTDEQFHDDGLKNCQRERYKKKCR